MRVASSTGPWPGQRVVVDARGEAQALEGGRHFLVEIAVQLGQARGQQLALGAKGDAAGELGLEGAVLDIAASPGDGAGTASFGIAVGHAGDPRCDPES